jgi:ketosteroid isomerase-like protein
MKNKVAPGLLSLLLMLFIIACNSKKAEPVSVIDKEQIKKEIQAKEDEFAAIYNSGELKNIGYYADDAITFYQNRAPITSSEERVAFFNEDIVSNTNIISFLTKEVFVSGDGIQVVEIGYYKVVDSANTEINTGNYMSLFEKRNGKYYCVRDMSASDMPVQ